MGRTQVMSKAEVETIVRMWRSGSSYRSIRGAVGCSNGPIFKYAVHSAAYRPPLCSVGSFFPLTSHHAWLLGLIFGDGSVSKRGPHQGGVARSYKFTITSGDKDMLHKANSILGGRNSIVHRRNDWGSAYCLNVNSKQLCSELFAQFGLCGRKDNSMRWPNIPNDVLPHFLRGLLDSDGGWAVCTEPRTSTPSSRLCFTYCTNSREFISSLRTVLIAEVGVSPRLNPTRQRRAWALLYGKHDSQRIGEYLYSPSVQSNRCDRKYNTWTKWYGLTNNLQ